MSATLDAVQEQFSRYEILIEFKNLQNRQHCPKSLYVHPSTHSVYTWYGVLFPPVGPYSNGVFKFALLIPTDYPRSVPSVSFLTEVWHPLVDPQSKWFDISARFPAWRKHKDFLCHVLWYIYECFTENGLAKLNPDTCINKDAAIMHRDEREHFHKCAQNVVQLSQTDGSIYDNSIKDNPIQFTPLSDKQFEEIKDKMLKAGKKLFQDTRPGVDDHMRQLLRSANTMRASSTSNSSQNLPSGTNSTNIG